MSVPPDYAGLWLRLVAFIIDSIILSVIHLLLIIPLYDVLWPTARYRMDELAFDGSNVIITQAHTFLSGRDFSLLILLVIAFVYYALMESSRYQASVGKLALELNITTKTGERTFTYSSFGG